MIGLRPGVTTSHDSYSVWRYLNVHACMLARMTKNHPRHTSMLGSQKSLSLSIRLLLHCCRRIHSLCLSVSGSAHTTVETFDSLVTLQLKSILQSLSLNVMKSHAKAGIHDSTVILQLPSQSSHPLSEEVHTPLQKHSIRLLPCS